MITERKNKSRGNIWILLLVIGSYYQLLEKTPFLGKGDKRKAPILNEWGFLMGD
jgi:hypothetical protein